MIFSFLKKIILLCIIFCVPQSFAETLSFSDIDVKSHSETKNIFKDKNKKLGYALGVSLGNYVNQSFEKQKKIGINLDKSSLLQGVQDAISGHLKLSHQEITVILKELEKN